MDNDKFYKTVARLLAAEKGIELTPAELEQSIANLVEKVRTVWPDLPDDPRKALEIIVKNTKIV